MSNQSIGGTVVLKRRLFGVGKLRDNALSQHFTEFHTPLIEGIDLPDGALCENAVLVERDEFAQDLRRQAIGQDRGRRTVALKRFVRHQPLGSSSRRNFLRRFTERQRLRLRQYIGEEQVMMNSQRIELVHESDEVAWDRLGSLVNE